jgi:hypothetical protein
MRRLGLLAGVAAAASACGTTSHAGYVLVTVDARPAVHDAASLTVTLANAGTMRTDTLMLGGKSFPVTFSVSSPGRTGDLAIAVDASDASGLVIGHGSAMTTVAAPSAEVMLDSTDFVVNTDYAGDQFPTDDFQAAGFQLAALPDGTWTTVFRDGCMQNACNVFARRFDRAGKPVTTQAAAGTNAFVVNVRPTNDLAAPAIAASQDATLAVWNFTDPVTTTMTGIACRPIDATGRLAPDQTALATESASVPSAAAMASGNFAVTWKTTLPAMNDVDAIHTVVVKPDCTPVGGIVELAKGAVFADFVHRGSVASSADQVLFAWITNGELYTSLMSGTSAPSPGVKLIAKTATLQVEHARVAAVPGGGFLLAVSWTLQTGTGPGRIDLFHVDTKGALAGSAVQVTDQSDGDPVEAESFGLASRSDGTVMLAWHVCASTGDSCVLSGRIFQLAADLTATAWAAPVTDAFAIPTTTGGSDKRASVVGLPDAFAVVWSDSSMKPPDTSGQAVRARIIYPPGS